MGAAASARPGGKLELEKTKAAKSHDGKTAAASADSAAQQQPSSATKSSKHAAEKEVKAKQAAEAEAKVAADAAEAEATAKSAADAEAKGAADAAAAEAKGKADAAEWASEEDDALLEACSQVSKDLGKNERWAQISRIVGGGHGKKDCASRYKELHKTRNSTKEPTAGQIPEWTFSSFLASLSLLDILAKGFNKGRSNSSKTEAQWAKDLSEKQVGEALDDSWPELRQEMIDQIQQLQKQDTVDACVLNDKFSAVDGSFTFTYGGMDTYHAGLEGLIGLPSPDVIKKMLWEHTESWYASISFDCWYIPGGTTAAQEYAYVDGIATETNCQNGLRDEGHSGWSIRDIMERNMDVIKEAKLQLAEVFALRLYTGPMYLWYNNILRYCRSATGPTSLRHIQLWKEQHATEEHPFVTTLHVINSAILKLSRVQPAEKVFRGNQGGVLPKEFWFPNKDNIRGGIELGFLSTTKDRAVAKKYSTENEGQPSMVFEIQMGMVDRGASIQFLSQFPAEEEILFAPLTGLEVVGTIQANGRTLVVQLRLNCNLHDLTIEQITAKMFKTHKDVLHTIKMELQMQGFVQEQLGPITKHEEFVDSKYKEEGGEWFGNADHYKDVTNRALDAKIQVCADAVAAGSSSEASKVAAAGVLFKEGDSAALAVAVVTLLQNENLRVEYGERLSKAAAGAAEYSELRLDLKDLGLTCELPDDVISLLLTAERFDISGNQFSNVEAESMRYDMIYKCSCMQKWREGGTLNFSVQKLTDENLVALGSLLPLIVGLAELNLSSNAITAAGAKRVAYAVRQCRSITSLNIANNNIGSEGAQHLSDAIKYCESLKKITFGGDSEPYPNHEENYEPVTMETTMTEADVSNRGVGLYVPIIAIFMGLCGSLTSIDVSNNNGDDEFAKHIADGIKECKSITSLNIASNGIRSEGAKHVSDAIKHCESLTSFNIAYNRIDSEGAKHVSDAIKHCESLTKLDVSHSNGNAQFAKHIADGIKECKSLTSIDVSNNHGDAEFAKHIADGIKECKSLTSINLSGNDLTDGGYAEDYNRITDMTGVEGLGKAIKQSSLKKITFGGDEKKTENGYGIGEYYEPVTMETTMTEVNCSGRKVGPYAPIIAIFMGRCELLTHLDVSKNNGDAEFAKHIADGIKECKSLVKLKMDKYALPIQNIKSATELDLSNNKGIGVLDIIVIAALNKSLTSIDLTNNNLARRLKPGFSGRYDDHYEPDMTGVEALGKAIKQSSLHKITFGEGVISRVTMEKYMRSKPDLASEVDRLDKILSESSHSLLIAQCKEQFGDSPELESITIETTMTEVDLSGKNLDTTGATIAAGMMPNCRSLKKITFGGDEKKEDGYGTGEYYEPVTMETTMTEVNCSGRKVGPYAPIIAIFMGRCESLTSIDVSNNIEYASEGPEFAKHIADGIKGCRSLKKIRLGGDEKKNPRGRGTGEYYEPVTMETTMTEVNCSDRGVGRYAHIIAIFMGRCESLLQLDISSNNIPSNLIQQIRDEHPAVTVLE